MAIIAGTTQTYDISSGGGIREDLEDTIWDLFPADTWAVSNLDRVDASATTHEWLAQELAAAAANQQIEGDDASFATLAAPTRYGNYEQILSKTFLVSDTLEATNRAGRGREAARGLMVVMREVKRDLEFAITRNQAGTVGGQASGRAMAGMETWIGGVTQNAGTAANAVRATTTADTATTPAPTGGVPATAPTDGSTTGALTTSALNSALQGAWEDGGDPSTILVSPNQKAVIDTFTGVATRFVDVDRAAQASIIGAANLYVSDFGRHTVVLHRYMRTSVVLNLDKSMWAIAFLRRPKQRELAKTGDGTKHQVIMEASLVSRNWKANSKVVACS